MDGFAAISYTYTVGVVHSANIKFGNLAANTD